MDDYSIPIIFIALCVIAQGLLVARWVTTHNEQNENILKRVRDIEGLIEEIKKNDRII